MKRMLTTLLALCLILSMMGTGAFAAEEEDSTLWFVTEDGQNKFESETPATVTMTVTVPADGIYLVTTQPEGPDGGPEGFSVTSEDEALAFLAEQELRDLWNGGHWPVELTAGDYAVTAENVTSMSMSLFLVDNTGMPDDIPPAAERVSARFWFTEDNKRTSNFRSPEPASGVMTAEVEQDGLYLVTVDAQGSESLSLAVDSDAFAFMSQLQPEDPYETGEYEIWKSALVELPAGEYTLQIENGTRCSVDVELTHPLDTVDGVIGEGLYVCQLDEAATVNYTVMGVGAEAVFYSGPSPESLSEAGDAWAYKKNSEQAVVSFEPGTAVIDFTGGYVTSALVGTTEGVYAAGSDGASGSAASAEPVEFDVDPANTDENGAVLGTVTVPADGYYLFTADALPMTHDIQVTFTSDLPIQTESDIVPDGTFSEKWNWYELRAAVHLTAGDYTVAVGGAMYGADLIPAQTVDSLAGTFADGGVYTCALAEPATVTFTLDANEVKDIYFYGGNDGGLLLPLTPAADGGTLTVEFPAGVAVIDAHNTYDPVTGTVN